VRSGPLARSLRRGGQADGDRRVSFWGSEPCLLLSEGSRDLHPLGPERPYVLTLAGWEEIDQLSSVVV